MKLAVVLSMFLSIPAVGFSQATWYVPDDFPTIQGAISDPNVVDGDTVIVRPGTYVENIDFLGKAIIVRSEQGPHVSLIDGGNPSDPDYGSVVSFRSGEGTDSVLDGFRITNGIGTNQSWNERYGGGIYCDRNSSPTISNNIISGNTSDLGGGLSFFNDSSPKVINNIISKNTAGWGSGGGIFCFLCNSLVIKHNILCDNSADLSGGGLCMDYSSATIANNAVFRNSAGSEGGGISCWNSISETTITNNVIFKNLAVIKGGGLSSNMASYSTITNSILWNNYAPSGKNIYVGDWYGFYPSTLTISYSDVKGGLDSAFLDPSTTLNWGPGMIDSNPLFVDPANGDFHLIFLSPCRGSGDNNAPGLPDYDFEGDSRIAYGTVDMGADECFTHLYYTGDATPGGSIELKFIDLPGASPVGFWIALDALEIPIQGTYGDWYLLSPLFGPWELPPIPSNGVLILPGSLPPTPTDPYDVYFQAIMGTPLKLTNLCTMHIE